MITSWEISGTFIKSRQCPGFYGFKYQTYEGSVECWSARKLQEIFNYPNVGFMLRGLNKGMFRTASFTMTAIENPAQLFKQKQKKHENKTHNKFRQKFKRKSGRS